MYFFFYGLVLRKIVICQTDFPPTYGSAALAQHLALTRRAEIFGEKMCYLSEINKCLAFPNVSAFTLVVGFVLKTI